MYSEGASVGGQSAVSLSCKEPRGRVWAIKYAEAIPLQTDCVLYERGRRMEEASEPR